ncbi:MAG: hypothetical protein M1118_01585 [Chloroflexi bacterium]|nr:hypothetical protein [Chloroflexota bacterium]
MAGIAAGWLVEFALRQWRQLHSLRHLVGAITVLLLNLALLFHSQLTFHALYTGIWAPQTAAISQPRAITRWLLRGVESGWYRKLLPFEPAPEEVITTFGWRYNAVVGPARLFEDRLLVRQVHS